MEKVMLSFDKVSAHYGKIQALHEVSLHINQGEIVTLIGANGAGNNTLIDKESKDSFETGDKCKIA